jgi:glycerophosphoryl diester phosphodiesterase
MVLAVIVATSTMLEAGSVEIIAHRGASHDAPENTLAALRLGFEQQCDAGECDVWVSKDGTPVVIHDADTKRVAGVPRKISEQTCDELCQLDVGRWKDVRFTGEKIPKLVDCLAIVPSGKRMFVEIKCGVEGVPAILSAIEQSKLDPQQIEVISFSSQVIAAVKKVRPDLKAYWIVALKDEPSKVTKVTDLIATAQTIQADGLDVSNHTMIDADFVNKVRKTKLRLYVWTVDNAQAAQRLRDLGVDGITTNRPAWLREQLQTNEQK